MRTRGARIILTTALAAIALGCAAAPAWSAPGTAQDEYTLELPGDNTGSASVDGVPPGGGTEENETGVQAGVAGETEEALSPLAAAAESPLALGVLAALGAALTLGLLMGTARPGSLKR